MAKVYDQVILDTNTFLTNFSKAFKMVDPVDDFIAPPFKVKLEAGKYVEYDETIYRIWDDKITGNMEPMEIEWDVDEGTYSCEEYSMGFFVSDKQRAQAVNGIKLDQDAVKYVKYYHHQARAYRIFQIAGSTALVNNTNIGGAWNTAAGTPVSDILDAIAAIANRVAGYKPNKILVPLQVALKLIKTTEWKDYFKYTWGLSTSGGGLFDFIEGIRNLNLEPLVTSQTGLSEYKGTTSDPTTEAIWGENVLIFYSEPSPSLMSRSFMYSPYVKKDVIMTTRVPRKRGVYHDIYSDIDELAVDLNLGQLLTNTI
jgi:hypothetical protein